MCVKNKPKKILVSLRQKAIASIKQNFWFATLNFIFIIGFIQIFQLIFGAQNGIVAIILSILMGIYAAKDVSIAPVKKFIIHTIVLCLLSAAACFSRALGAWIAIPINLTITFCILYAYTYDYSNHLYFPYILSYLFLLFISPVAIEALPLRLGSIAAGTFCMMLYALILKNRNIEKPAQQCLKSLIESCETCAQKLYAYETDEELQERLKEAHMQIYRLSQNAEMRKKGSLNYNENAFSFIDIGRTLEAILITLSSYTQADNFQAVYLPLSQSLHACKQLVCGKTEYIPFVKKEDFDFDDEKALLLYRFIDYVRQELMNTQLKHMQKSRKQKIPFKKRIKAFIDYSPTKLHYALRVSLLISMFLIPVQYLQLQYGKWLLFTLASVSLPYADDVRKKGKKRFAATVIGGVIATVCFSLFSDASVRMAIMMISGYLSFYFKDYLGNYACATVGALGGAVAVGITGWADVSTIFGLRLCYIALGILIAYAANLLLFPYRRKKASEFLYRNYRKTVKQLCEFNEQNNRQLYCNLLIRNDLLEEKLLCNAAASPHFDEIEKMIAENCSNIRRRFLQQTLFP